MFIEGAYLSGSKIIKIYVELPPSWWQVTAFVSYKMILKLMLLFLVIVWKIVLSVACV